MVTGSSEVVLHRGGLLNNLVRFPSYLAHLPFQKLQQPNATAAAHKTEIFHY